MDNNTWEIKNNKLTKTFTFDNFSMAVNFINRIAKTANDLNHHPDIFIHDYNQVTVSTISHDQNAITDRDHKLSKEIDALQ